MNFFDGPLYVLYLGWEVKNDVSGQSQDVLRVCNVNIRKSLLGQKQSTCSWPFWLAAPSVKWSEFFFMALLLTINPTVAKRFWLIPNLHLYGCMDASLFYMDLLELGIIMHRSRWQTGVTGHMSNGVHIWHLFVMEAPLLLLYMLTTHTGVGSTLQASGQNCKLLGYLEVRDRIVD